MLKKVNIRCILGVFICLFQVLLYFFLYFFFGNLFSPNLAMISVIVCFYLILVQVEINGLLFEEYNIFI